MTAIDYGEIAQTVRETVEAFGEKPLTEPQMMAVIGTFAGYLPLQLEVTEKGRAAYKKRQEGK